MLKEEVYLEYTPVDQNDVKKQGIRPMETTPIAMSCFKFLGTQITKLALTQQQTNSFT